MSGVQHDPGSEVAGVRAGDLAAPAPMRVHGAEVRVGTASWTDRTMTARGVFYPQGAGTPEARLRYYATHLSMVEADAGFYAIPDRQTVERWVERTPPDFIFNVKAHALMTGHAAEVARLPRAIRDELRSVPDLGSRVYAKDLAPEIRDEVWRQFRAAIEPLHDARKLGAVLLQFAPWIRPSRHTPALLTRIRERLDTLPVAVEFRHPSWLEPRSRERVWDQLRDHGMTYVVADTPQDTPTSVPIAPAVTTPELAIVRLHGRRRELWGARGAPVVEKYRYLYSPDELEDWLMVLLELADQAERLHVVFNNCYANYGTTNALEMAALLEARP